jgi:hypothetical protein
LLLGAAAASIAAFAAGANLCLKLQRQCRLFDPDEVEFLIWIKVPLISQNLDCLWGNFL